MAASLQKATRSQGLDESDAKATVGNAAGASCVVVVRGSEAPGRFTPPFPPFRRLPARSSGRLQVIRRPQMSHWLGTAGAAHYVPERNP